MVTEKSQALKNSVKSFDVAIIESKDPAKQLYYTTTDVARELEGLLERGLKVYVTLHITFKKRKIEDGDSTGPEKFLNIKMLISIVILLLL